MLLPTGEGPVPITPTAARGGGPLVHLAGREGKTLRGGVHEACASICNKHGQTNVRFSKISSTPVSLEGGGFLGITTKLRVEVSMMSL